MRILREPDQCFSGNHEVSGREWKLHPAQLPECGDWAELYRFNCEQKEGVLCGSNYCGRSNYTAFCSSRPVRGAMMLGFLATIAKMPALAKAAVIAAILVSGESIAGFQIHDLCRDYVMFILLSAVVTGMPEPDTDLKGARFFYTWLYRTGHLIVGSGTSFFGHQKKLAEGENDK